MPWNASSHRAKLKVLTGSEVAIRAYGSLGYPEEKLMELDVVVAPVPSAIGQEQDKMARRIISTEAHAVESLDAMRFGVAVATQRFVVRQAHHERSKNPAHPEPVEGNERAMACTACHEP